MKRAEIYADKILPIWILARQEFIESYRNRWVIGCVATLFFLALLLSLLGSTPTGALGISGLAVLLVSLINLSLYLIPLLALLLGFDAIIGEKERGTLALLLTCPIESWQIILGKFFGHGTILGLASLLGFGGVMVLNILILPDENLAPLIADFILMIFLVFVLGLNFIAISYMVSAWVASHATAIIINIAIWIFMVILYDVLLFAVLANVKPVGVTSPLLSFFIIINPTDSYRLLMLFASEDASAMIGFQNIKKHISPIFPCLSLIFWLIMPLLITNHFMKQRKLS